MSALCPLAGFSQLAWLWLMSCNIIKFLIIFLMLLFCFHSLAESSEWSAQWETAVFSLSLNLSTRALVSESSFPTVQLLSQLQRGAPWSMDGGGGWGRGQVPGLTQECVISLTWFTPQLSVTATRTFEIEVPRGLFLCPCSASREWMHSPGKTAEVTEKPTLWPYSRLR